MLRNREIRLSIHDRLVTMFELPDAASGLTAYNVYDEDEYRDDTHVEVFPFVYIVDSNILPVATKLPLIVIEVQRYRKQSFEMGNRSGREVRAFIHVFGRTRADRDDMAGFIADYFGNSLSIKTYTQAVPAGTEVEKALMGDRIDVEQMSLSGPVEGRDEAEIGGSVSNWARVGLDIDCKL